MHCHALLTPPHILACYSPSKLLLSNRLTGYMNTMQLMILSLIPRPALKWFWDKTQADWNLDAFLLPAVSTFILHSNSCYSSSVAKQETNKTSASLKSQMCSIFIYIYTIWLLYLVYEGYIVSQSQNSLESDPVSKGSGIIPSLKRVWNQTQSQKGLESDPVSNRSGIRPSLK